jgi:DNA-binding NarL/FixJ family response regulator
MDPWVSIVLLGAAVAGWGWLLPKPERAGELRSEEAYDRLLEDLEAENRELVDAVTQFKKEQDETVDRLSRRIRELERQVESFAARSYPTAPAAEPAPNAAASADDSPPPREEASVGQAPAEEPAASPVSIRARYAELLGLHARGRSVEQIAKAMNMNKGEVQLILQLAKREEMQRA